MEKKTLNEAKKIERTNHRGLERRVKLGLEKFN